MNQQSHKSNDVGSSSTSKPRIFIIVENLKKTNSLGPILRCAAGFAVTQVIKIGYDKCNTEGSHGAAKHVPQISFPTIGQAIAYAKTACNCPLVTGLLMGSGTAGAFSKDGYYTHRVEQEKGTEGDLFSVGLPYVVEQTTTSQGNLSYPVHAHKFGSKENSNICLVIGKNPNGLPSHLVDHCDNFVHVPQVPIAVSQDDDEQQPALLDVASCLSIILHHMTQWAGYYERMFQGQKFEVDKCVQKGRLNSFQPNLEGLRQDLDQTSLRGTLDETIEENFGCNLFCEDKIDGDY
mmetsp:Transcript_2074/g.2948  ORF Transcript_2074/g.2948 Transcript_2074/m.2948 type:complete len:292 (-) Transcript_2074:2982-3857(-)